MTPEQAIQYHKKQINIHREAIYALRKLGCNTELTPIEKKELSRVCKKYDVSVEDIVSVKRQKFIMKARKEYVVLMIDKYHKTYNRVGEILGFRDHSSILYLYKTGKNAT